MDHPAAPSPIRGTAESRRAQKNTLPLFGSGSM